MGVLEGLPWPVTSQVIQQGQYTRLPAALVRLMGVILPHKIWILELGSALVIQADAVRSCMRTVVAARLLMQGAIASAL